MNIQQTIMTPAFAQELLTKNKNNRKIRRSLILKISQDIKDNKWHLTHQPIAIDKHGCVLDGQHRLTAIAETGIPVQLMLATNCEPETMIAIDTGNTRTVGDVLTINGTKNATLKAAIIKLYKSYYEHPNVMWAGRNAYSVQTINEAMSGIKDFDLYINVAKRSVREFGPLTVSAVVTFILLALDADYNLETIENFLYRLSTGDQVSPVHPIYAYRQYMINSTKSKYIHSKATQRSLADCIKVFNLTIACSELRKYHPPTLPPMPKIL